jgi:NADPH:quinone reductase-like Zn-dependent oxidoreductase
LIRVCAAGVWHRTGTVPRHEFSGVIAGIGPDIRGAYIGQEVFGINDWISDGAMAEYCLAPYSAVAPKPRRLSHSEAASVPISALTAWQGLFDRAKLQFGERVLVHGGAGAVGIFAVQLATLYGARVTATASARDLGFLAGLGADEVIDYRASTFEDCVRDMDIVFDTVGGKTRERSWSVLKPSGRMVTIATCAATAEDERTRKAFFTVQANQKQLTWIAGMLDAQQVRAFVAAAIPQSQAAVRRGYRNRGKQGESL